MLDVAMKIANSVIESKDIATIDLKYNNFGINFEIIMTLHQTCSVFQKTVPEDNDHPRTAPI